MHEELPRGWVKTTLGEVCSPVETIRPEDSPHTKFTYFDIGGVDNERNLIAETKTLTGQSAPSRARQAVRKDDILFSTVRTYLRKIARVEDDYPNPVASTGFTVIRPAEGVSSQFLFFQILSEEFLQPLHALQTGTSYPAVRNRDVFAQPIVLAPTGEQKRIVMKLDAAFSRMADGETAAKRAHERLRRYCAAVLKAACEGQLVPTEAELSRQHGTSNANLETGEALLHRILKARYEKWKGKGKHKEPAVPSTIDLPKPPEGWTWASPDQLSEFDDNAICAGPFGTIFKAKDFRPAGVPIIFLRHVAAGRYLTDKPGFMDKQKWKESFRPYSVFGGELLITKLGEPPGVCAIYPKEIGPAMVTPDVIKFAVHEAAALPKFLMHYFNSEKARQFSTGVAFGTTRLRLTLPIFREMPVPLPPFAEQTRIVADVERRLLAADRLAATLEQQIVQSRSARQSLLREAFSGRLVAQTLNDEPASVLLKRICADREAEAQKPKGKRMFKSKSKSKVERRPLLDILQEHKNPMTPEQLFREAGFEQSQVDLFYRELTSLRDKLQEKKPEGSDAKLWPHRADVLLQLKRGDEK